MRHHLVKSTLLLIVLLAFTTAHAENYYVTPTASTPCPEEGVPCFTFSQYAHKSNSYFASNTTLIFLPGSHSLDSEFNGPGNDSLTIIRSTTTYSYTSITCSHSARFILNDIGVISMRGLVLIGCMNNSITSVEQFILEDCSLQGRGRNGTGLELNKVTSASILKSCFFSYAGEETILKDNRHDGAVYVFSSNVVINSNTFNNSTVNRNGGTVYARSSNVTMDSNIFNNNTVNGDGAIVHVYLSNVNMVSNTFNNNTMFRYGAMVHVYSSKVTTNNNTFNNSTVNGDPGNGGAVSYFAWSSNVIIINNTFNTNTMTGDNGDDGALSAWSSNVTINNNVFNNNIVSGYGAAVYVHLSNVTMTSNIFNNNTVNGDPGYGGAVFASGSTVTMSNNTFNNSTVTGESGYGGAVSVLGCNVTMNSNIFNNNTVRLKGGAVYACISNVTMTNNTFNSNTVSEVYGYGGAVSAWSSNVTMNSNTFNSNAAIGDYGRGGAVSVWSNYVTMDSNTFNNNSATQYGSAVFLDGVTLNSTGFLDIQNNMADISGTLYALQSTLYFSGNTTVSNNYGSLYAYACNVTFMGHTNIMNNSYSANAPQEGGAVTAFQSEIIFTGRAYLTHNTAIHGGAISATQSKIHVYGDITIAYNTAFLSGGGIYAYQSELSLQNHINIINNSAGEKGGGIHVISSYTKMKDHSKTYLVGNHAKRGGGACLEMNAKLYIVKKKKERISKYYDRKEFIRLEFTENTADYGGALYITDDTNSGICHAAPFSGESTISSECFIQGLMLKTIDNNDRSINIHNTFFTNNSATKVGHEIYGGLLDRCTVNPYAEIFQKVDENYDPMFTQSSLSAESYIFHITTLNIQYFNNSTKIISSHPVRVCFCTDNQPDCSYHPQPVYVKKGETFTVSLVAVDQVNNTISNSTIHARSSLGKLGEGQSVQKTNDSCTELKYTIFSSYNSDVVHLYAEGPCKDIGISTAILTVYIEACPVGFMDTNKVQRCACEIILLNKYISNCSINDQTVLRKDNVWFSYVNTTDHPHSYILHKHCPFDYCRPPTESVHVNLTIPNGADAMCVFNRMGKLCGSCKDGLSLSLGSSRCMKCSNKWLALLIVFAVAGVALVAFLLVCNLTVAAGTVNGLLFYANIVSSNQTTFFPNSTNKFFIIFIAWLNLDFGFETCYFNGLNGYWKTWLQLAFPAYVIFLVILVIKACEYFNRFARLIARKNPVAILDTLVMLSYTKFIRTIISAWQFATLEYSDGAHEIVWLIDANIKYFGLKHIPLFVAALVILIVALIYTLLLFLWQWLLLCPNRQPVSWIRNSRLHGIMDAYFITFNKNHRYWTGLLLLARVLLYLVSALNGMQTNDPRMNLLAIIMVVGSLILWSSFTRGRIYRKQSLNILDTSFLFNLLILTATTFYIREVGGNQTAVASISVSITSIAFILIISYHVYAFVLHNEVDKIKRLFKKAKSSDSQSQPNARSVPKKLDDDVTVSVVDVPLIPLDTEGNPILDGFDTDEDDDWSDTDTTDNINSTSERKVNEDQAVELEDISTKISDEYSLNIGYIEKEKDVSSATCVENHSTISTVEVECFTANNETEDPLNMNEYSGRDDGEEDDEYYDEQTPLLS